MPTTTKTKTQHRLSTVLSRLNSLVITDEDFAEALSDDMENLLTDIHGQDGFGTEGQNDPRGDFRNGDFSMNYIEGVDT